jgi:hypothetical protein
LVTATYSSGAAAGGEVGIAGVPGAEQRRADLGGGQRGLAGVQQRVQRGHIHGPGWRLMPINMPRPARLQDRETPQLNLDSTRS